MADFIEIVEVSPRDGIQNEPKLLDRDQKIALIERSIDAGLRRVEVTSFVNPKRVPQMADADAIAAKLPKSSDTRFIGLTLNRRGFERAAAAGLHEANFVIVASDSFNRRNQGVSSAESIAAFAEITASNQTVSRSASPSLRPLAVPLRARCRYRALWRWLRRLWHKILPS